MKIVHVISSLSPNLGGLPVACLNLAANQAKLGHEVTILTQHIVSDRESQIFITSVRYHEKINYLSLPYASNLKYLLDKGHSIMLAVESLQPNVLHLHGVWEPFLLYVGRWALSNKLPYIISPHGMLYPYCLSEKSFKKKIALKLFYKRFIDHASALHVLNNDEKDAINSFINKQLVFVASNGVDDALLEFSEKNNINPSSQFGVNKPYFLFLGRLHPIKGLDLLLESFGWYVNQGGLYDLALIGPDGGSLKSISNWLERNDDIKHRVLMPGSIYGDEKYTWIINSLAYIQTSKHETFSMSITEALALSKPVIITKNCHFPEVAEVGAGFVTDPCPEKISSCMLKIDNSPKVMEDMGRAGSLLVRKRFQWERTAADLVTGYSALT